jgi:hypothetical protein
MTPRLVGRADGAVVDHDHAPAGEAPRHGDRAGERGVHGLTRVAEQVDTAVPAPELGLRRVEPADHLRAGRERPDGTACGRRPGLRPPGGRRGDDREGGREEHGEEEGERAHASRLGRGGRVGQPAGDVLWTAGRGEAAVDGERSPRRSRVWSGMPGASRLAGATRTG